LPSWHPKMPDGSPAKPSTWMAVRSFGAYLMLILDYYGNARPCPDDDFILAAVAKLPVEVWKERYRKVLAPFFVIQDGHWFHERIEEELRDGVRRHTAAVIGSESAKKAREAKKSGQKTDQTPDRTPARSKDTGSDTGADTGAESVQSTRLQEHSLLTREREARAREVPSGSPGKEGLGTLVDPKFWPEPDRVTRCHQDGADEQTLKDEVELFVKHHGNIGTRANDWDSAWLKWWARWRERIKEKPGNPPPVVHVNRKDLGGVRDGVREVTVAVSPRSVCLL
jgi:uncharacterized protein YdaU (DUF1376 family)